MLTISVVCDGAARAGPISLNMSGGQHPLKIFFFSPNKMMHFVGSSSLKIVNPNKPSITQNETLLCVKSKQIFVSIILE